MMATFPLYPATLSAVAEMLRLGTRQYSNVYNMAWYRARKLSGPGQPPSDPDPKEGDAHE